MAEKSELQTLAGVVRSARRERGLSQDEMVRRSGLSLSAIRKIEAGQTPNPGVFTVLRLWESLELPLSQLEALDLPAQGFNGLD